MRRVNTALYFTSNNGSSVTAKLDSLQSDSYCILVWTATTLTTTRCDNKAVFNTLLFISELNTLPESKAAKLSGWYNPHHIKRL